MPRNKAYLRQVVERLLAANPAMVSAEDKHGKTAAWWARRRGHTALAAMLAALEAERGSKRGQRKYQVAPEEFVPPRDADTAKP